MSSIDPYTAEQWAQGWCEYGHQFPVTSENIRAIVSWEYAESGNPPNAARFNPLNTTQHEPGAWPYNYNGGYPVLNYPDYSTGIRANSTAIHNGYYTNVVAALQAGNNAQAVVDAVVRSPWGTRHITLVGPPPHPPSPPPVKPPVEVLLTTVAHPKVGTVRPVPFYGAVLCENGARLKGDKPNGAKHVWTSPDAQVQATGSHLIDITETPKADGIYVLFDLGGGDARQYFVPWG